MRLPVDGAPATVIRRATVADAPEIARMHVQSWRETYADAVPAAVLAGLDVEARVERWEGILAREGSTTHVASAADAVVGFANAGPGRDADAPVARELEGIYVLGSHHRERLGSRLLTAAIGTHDAYLWVWTGNRHAIAFYRSHGFELDGVVEDHPLAGHSMEVARMVRLTT